MVLANSETNTKTCQYTGFIILFFYSLNHKTGFKEKAKIKIFKLLYFALHAETHLYADLHRLKDWDSNEIRKQESNTMKNY